jgi:hypothetical protein
MAGKSYKVVGALIVAALVFFLFGDRIGLRSASPVNVKLETPAAPAAK